MSENTGVSLTQINYAMRLMIKYGLVGIVLFFVGRALYFSTLRYVSSILPSVQEQPTAGFGPLPQLKFLSRKTFEKPSSYALGLPIVKDEYQFPNFSKDSNLIKVYPYVKNNLNLLIENKIINFVKLYGFNEEPQILNETTYRFAKEKSLRFSLDIDILSNNIAMTSDYLLQKNFVSGVNLPDQFNAMQAIKNFLNIGGLLPSDFGNDSYQINYVKILGTRLEEVKTIHEANFLRVDLNRAPINDQYGFVYPDPKRAIIQLIVGAYGNKQIEIVEMEYQYQKIDFENYHTYPLRTVESAWRVLQSGEGYVASRGINNEAVIEKIELGYYEVYDEQDYLQPVYIFSNQDGFLGYVPAIDPRYVNPSI